MRIINLEDNAIKHSTIKRVLNDMRITDMQYPLCGGGNIDRCAGEFFINSVSERNINIPIIICSSDNLQYDNVLGCVWYIDTNYWEQELTDLIKKIGDFHNGKRD